MSIKFITKIICTSLTFMCIGVSLLYYSVKTGQTNVTPFLIGVSSICFSLDLFLNLFRRKEQNLSTRD